MNKMQSYSEFFSRFISLSLDYPFVEMLLQIHGHGIFKN